MLVLALGRRRRRHFAVGLRALRCRFGFRELRAQHGGIHLREELSFLDHVALLHMHRLDAPLLLRRDVHLRRLDPPIARRKSRR
jgi:hypothetical protein